MAGHGSGRYKNVRWWRSALFLGMCQWLLLTAGAKCAVAKSGAGKSDERRRPLGVTVLESIDLGDVLVMGDTQMDVGVAADGQRTSAAGSTIFGSLPFGSGRLRVLGEPGACVRLAVAPFKRRAEAGRIRVRRVLLRVSNAVGQEAIDLRLDLHGQATVEVGVQLRLSAIRQSRSWQLALSFEARYSDDCLH